MAKRKRTKKQLIQFFTQYGIHIWAILIIANAALVYAYQFSTHAASKNDTALHILDTGPSVSPSLLPSQANTQEGPSPSVAPLGPSINLTFTVPGIGSGGGTLKPVHLKRNVTVFLYPTNVNSLNATVKPLYTIQGSARYDDNPSSPTYTSFVNPVFDLGSDVKDGSYQILFRTDQSLRTLIKQNPTDIGGETFDLSKGLDPIQIPSQTVMMGDTIPVQGDNKIDINDYNAFINCYGNKNTTDTFCKGGNYGDFNDDGVIDGIDYNILLRSLGALSQEGLPIPTLSPTPVAPTPPKRISRLQTTIQPTPQKKTQKATSSATTKTQPGSKGSAAVGGILFLLFLIVLGAIGFILYKKNENVRTLIRSIIHLSPTGTPSAETTDGATEQAGTETKTEEQPQDGDQATESEQPTTEEAQAAAPAPPAAPPTAPPGPPAAGTVIEKDCYIKTKGADEKGTGMWLLLTDDNGAMNAHYFKNDAKDGFAKVKGTMKSENGKNFLEISELTAEG